MFEIASGITISIHAHAEVSDTQEFLARRGSQMLDAAKSVLLRNRINLPNYIRVMPAFDLPDVSVALDFIQNADTTSIPDDVADWITRSNERLHSSAAPSRKILEKHTNITETPETEETTKTAIATYAQPQDTKTPAIVFNEQVKTLSEEIRLAILIVFNLWKRIEKNRNEQKRRIP